MRTVRTEKTLKHWFLTLFSRYINRQLHKNNIIIRNKNECFKRQIHSQNMNNAMFWQNKETLNTWHRMFILLLCNGAIILHNKKDTINTIIIN